MNFSHARHAMGSGLMLSVDAETAADLEIAETAATWETTMTGADVVGSGCIRESDLPRRDY